MLEAPPLNGAYAYLSQCDDHKIKMIMRDSGIVASLNDLAMHNKEDLLALCKENGIGPGVPDEWTMQKHKARMQNELNAHVDKLSPRSKGRLRASARRKVSTPSTGSSKTSTGRSSSIASIMR